MQLSYKQIVKLLQYICDNHYFVKRNEYGEVDLESDTFGDLNVFIQRDTSFPCVFISSQAGVSGEFNTGGYNQIDYSFGIIYIDKLNEDQNNLLDIHTDGFAFANDLKIILNQYSDHFDAINDYTITPYKQKFSEWCAGVAISINIQSQAISTKCNIPLLTNFNYLGEGNLINDVDCNEVDITMSNVSGTYPVDTTFNESLVANGGHPQYSYELISGDLPTGVSLHSVVGRLFGTPTEIGTFISLIRVTDFDGCTSNITLEIEIE